VKLRWTDGAVEDLQAARDYLEAENPRAASDAINRIMSAVERLSQFPQMVRPGRVAYAAWPAFVALTGGSWVLVQV
jgi:plasmid stabilization system protein ParE